MGSLHRPGRARPVAVVGAVLVFVVVSAGIGRAEGWWQHAETGRASGDPFAVYQPYVASSPLLDAAAEQARADGDDRAAGILDRLGTVPTGIWLTPEALPTPTAAAAFVAETMTAADGRLPLFVVYGIPGRDCAGGQSSGGLDDAAYLPWVTAIADAAGQGGHAAIVLEPDALATADECHLRADRVRELRAAVGVLAEAGVTTYVDAGHSGWTRPSTMADLLTAVGVERVRGFSTDVANYQPEGAELAYATALRARLGIATHFIVDTGRDGDGGEGDGQGPTDWCNPPGRALGRAPGYVDDGTGLDAVAWVKPPAESDGNCHGGPAAGEIWTQRAVELATAAGW